MVISLISLNIAGQTKKSTCLTMTFVGKSQHTSQDFPTRLLAMKRHC